VQLRIEKLIYGGDGLARLAADERGPGKSVFVPFVLEGELAEAELTENKPGFARARLERVLEPSDSRITAACPYFQHCGGCHYQHTNYEQQVDIKATILRETLRRTAKMELPCQLQVHPSPPWNYRNRTRLKVSPSPEFAVGYHRFRSHELLPVEQCPISSPLINKALQAMWASGRAGQAGEEVREIEFFADNRDASLLMEARCAPRTSRQVARRTAEMLKAIMPEVAGVAVFEQERPGQMPHAAKLAEFGAGQLMYHTQLCPYRVSAGSFFQVNRFLVDELVASVTSGLQGDLALDLYAGVGLFAVALARSFAQVIAVEASQTSFADLRHNAAPEVRAVQATTEQYLRQASGRSPDLVVADPPRGGLGENVVRGLARLGPTRMVYVSCDPSTLARDLRIFADLGYRIEAAHLLDLFPQTYHIETVFHLAR